MTSGRDLAVKPGARTVAAQRAAPGPIDPLLDQMRRRREELGLLQTDVAGTLGVVQSTYSKWERGTVAPLLWTLRRMAEALDCDITLVPRTPPPPVVTDEMAGIRRRVGRELTGRRAKQRDVVKQMTGEVPAWQIAAWLGVSRRTVQRYQRELREAA